VERLRLEPALAAGELDWIVRLRTALGEAKAERLEVELEAPAPALGLSACGDAPGTGSVEAPEPRPKSYFDSERVSSLSVGPILVCARTGAGDSSSCVVGSSVVGELN
jgi:hypothetical protein